MAVDRLLNSLGFLPVADLTLEHDFHCPTEGYPRPAPLCFLRQTDFSSLSVSAISI